MGPWCPQWPQTPRFKPPSLLSLSSNGTLCVFHRVWLRYRLNHVLPYLRIPNSMIPLISITSWSKRWSLKYWTFWKMVSLTTVLSIRDDTGRGYLEVTSKWQLGPLLWVSDMPRAMEPCQSWIIPWFSFHTQRTWEKESPRSLISTQSRNKCYTCLLVLLSRGGKAPLPGPKHIVIRPSRNQDPSQWCNGQGHHTDIATKVRPKQI